MKARATLGKAGRREANGVSVAINEQQRQESPEEDKQQCSEEVRGPAWILKIKVDASGELPDEGSKTERTTARLWA